ncbi:T9SS type A sorting domain-containing protein [Epilithonimonas sp.]|uniref:T9SS type A sorting domain-containing protein n=1 Tax=Epilithonimonas sp. TaxID=2894511 RepID=UPI002FDEB76B
MPEASVNIDIETLVVNDIKNNKLLVYPNPFADQVTISFDLKSNSEVNVKIYDVNGRIVKTIKSNEKKGLNNLTIDTKDLRTGLYFYNLKTNSGESTGKLIKK